MKEYYQILENISLKNSLKIDPNLSEEVVHLIKSKKVFLNLFT